jgi:hypothetical protein
LKEFTEKIKLQILEIRKSENCPNMFDVNAVQRLAFENDFYELAEYLIDNKREYCSFILTGKAEIKAQ